MLLSVILRFIKAEFVVSTEADGVDNTNRVLINLYIIPQIEIVQYGNSLCTMWKCDKSRYDMPIQSQFPVCMW